MDIRASYAIASPASRALLVVEVGAGDACEVSLLEHAHAATTSNAASAAMDSLECFITSFFGFSGDELNGRGEVWE